MAGWNLTLYRLADGGTSPATAESPQGARLANWQAGFNGLRWLHELVTADNAISLGGSGYPSKYTATAKHLIPQIIDKPPDAYRAWTSGTQDDLTNRWKGRTIIDRGGAAACRPDEWLLVVAWDQS
jgi:hypothetical protein